MPEVMFRFDMVEEQEEFQDALNGSAYHGTLFELYNRLRSKLKHEELSDEQYKCYEQVRNWLFELAESHGVDVVS